ncbi:hypothetical protein C1645_811144 [Glomus cerebriforme]|uniref:DUF7431 domain-containing protein n=1 Tax=Glomus cerebriforme TaxID=658196 RepID=A0A397TP87_9GLOM|nr:hypothetical protein C1645_811144 [Glomus cerebriforme]
MFAKIVRETEKEIRLKEILEFKNEGSKSYLYLMKDSSPNWNILNDKFNLDYGLVALNLNDPNSIKIRKILYKHNGRWKLRHVKYSYQHSSEYAPLEEPETHLPIYKIFINVYYDEDWMNKKKLFINIDGVNVHNIVKFGLSVGISKNETFNEEINSMYSYTEVSKVSLKFSEENLELTSEFINEVNDAIKAKNREKFREIIEKYASENSVEKSKEGSVNTNIGPSTIKIGDAECNVFAAVIDTEDSKNIHFNCQIVINSKLNDRPIEPCVLINSIQKIFKKCKYKLVIKLLIIGYDIEFLNNPKYIVGIITLKNRYNDLLERNVPFFEIPILIDIESNNPLIIGHNFQN